MPLVNTNEILSHAQKYGYGVLAFDTLDYITADAFIAEAEQREQPVIMMVGESTMPLIDTKRLFPFLIGLAQNSSVPVALQLDHGKSMEVIRQCIAANFTSIMFDGSALPLKENIRQTQEIVALCHASNVSVEAELGQVSGGEGDFDGSEVDESMYTDPQIAKMFVELTGIDALAVAFGTVHGVYKGEPKLDLQRLAQLRQTVSIPLVMHGSSGLSDEVFQSAIRGGISKVNVFTEISLGAVEAAHSAYQANQGKLHFVQMLGAAQRVVSKKFGNIFNQLRSEFDLCQDAPSQARTI